MRCWTSGLLVLALVGCAGTPVKTGGTGKAAQHPVCAVLVDAWVEHFQANVRRLDGQQLDALGNQLQQARQGLEVAEIAEQSCNKPMCIIEPKANGRLESYCGYRIDDESGSALYRWVRWQPSSR